MKAIYKNIALAALALSAVACTQDEDLSSSFLNDPQAVRITAQVATGNVTGGFTRSNPLGTAEQQAKFNNGDKVAVTAGTQTAVTYTFNGTDTWTPEEGKYLKWVDNSMTFNAWYPVTQGTDATTFTVPTSYADVNAMAAADYMVYSGSQSKTDGNSVTLTMNRKMARIVINPTLNEQFVTGYSITGIKVHGNTDGYANGEVHSGNIEVTALEQSGVYYALLAPTTADANATFLTVTVAKNDGTNSQNLTVKGIPATEAGKSYGYTLTVGKDKATIGSVTVNSWTDGTAIPGGEAEEEEKEIPYLTFTTINGEQTLALKQIGNYTLDPSIEYSVNGGEWTKFEWNQGQRCYGPVSFGGENGNLRMRGTSESGMAGDYENYVQIKFGDSSVGVACSGDIRTLVDYENYSAAETEEARFCYLFSDCSSLTTAPSLPATNLADDCYNHMFYGCTSLTTAPSLPAETLAVYCYESMFQECTSLVDAPSLPAETLAEACYYFMFRGCTSLTNVTMLATDIKADGCLTYWLEGVAATGTFTKAASLEQGTESGKIPTGVHGIPDGWTVHEYVAQGN